MDWDTSRIYSYSEGSQFFYFHSPDGVGRIYHDTLEQAKEQTGLKSVVYLMGVPD